MRLLNVYTKTFSEFDDAHIPPYTITSHRWCDDEARFKDIHKSKYRPSEGLKKVEGFCQFVRDENTRRATPGRADAAYEWIWLDTVCINKDSDAEVTESINSMFRWYRRAQVCIAYMVDVRPMSAGREAVLFDYQRSNWFTRGWTLQELIAPRQVVFLTSAWEVIGMTRCSSPKDEAPNLGNLIEQITGIPRHVFGDREQFRLESLTLAERSRWIQRRETTKIEDMAYCLLGILGVNMPLVYGERGNAWQRLEDEASRKYRTEVCLPKPNVLNKRSSRMEFPFWPQPRADQLETDTDGLATNSIASSPSQTVAVVSPGATVEEHLPASRRQSPGSPEIPRYHPDNLGEGLLKAAADGNTSNLISFLRRGADFNYRDRSGLTPLHHAALKGHHTAADELIAFGVDVNAQSLELGTPLCLAAIQGQGDMVRLLLKSKARVNEPGRWTGTPLHCACWNATADVAEILLNAGADVIATHTIWTSFLEYGSNLGSTRAGRTRIARRVSDVGHLMFDCQPIVISAHRRQETTVQLLLDWGFPLDLEHRLWWSETPAETSFEDADEKDRCEKETVLLAASWKGPFTLLLKLLNAGAAVDKRDSWGRFALWIAAQSGQLESVQVLIEAGADVNAVTNSGKSALHVAIEAGHAGIVKYLIEKGADFDRADHEARTACHFAAFKGNVQVLEELFSRNARYSSQDRYGLTPLHSALQPSNNIAAVEYLIEHHANLLTTDYEGRTPLHYAAKRGSSAVLLLLDAGADAATQDTHGYRASAYLPAKTPDEIRRALIAAPFGDDFPRNLHFAWPSSAAGSTEAHGRSLSDSSVNAVGASIRKNSQGIPDMEAAVSPARTNTYRRGLYQ